MPLSTNINTYADVAAVLEQAAPHGKASYRLPTAGKATHFMQRAYKYRLLLQRQVRDQAGVKNFQPATPYDNLKMKVVGTAVELDFAPEPQGELTLPGGKVLKPKAITIEPVAPKVDAPADAPLFRPRTAPALDALSEAAAALLAKEAEDEG